MPFTFFAHQAFVIPFKSARPSWFDGTALCVGSMAPDFAYVFEGTRLSFPSHTLSAQFVWSVPVTLVLTLAWRHLIADPLGRHLPQPLGGEIQALSRARRPLGLLLPSALLGALSHIAIDGFTHRSGWAVAGIPVLRRTLPWAGLELEVWRVLQYAGHVFGSALGFAMLCALIRNRRFSAWSGATAPPQTSLRSPARFWLPLGIAGLLSIPAAMTAVLIGGGAPAAVMRCALVLFAGLTCGAIVVRSAGNRED